MNLAIIDCGAGNLRSLQKAFEWVADDDAKITLTRDPAEILKADRIVLPGQGAYGDCLESASYPLDLLDSINQKVDQDKTPLLGICVGMQLFADQGFERGVFAGLGYIGGKVIKLQGKASLPHIGWNRVELKQKHFLFADWDQDKYCYFAHSYHFQAPDQYVFASSFHGQEFTSVVARENIIGLQFHPEKSSSNGLFLLKRFLNWLP